MNVVKLASAKGYSVDFNGEIRNRKGQKINGCFKKSGYVSISLRHEGKKYYCLVHRLQAYQKYGEFIFTPGLVVRHKDGKPNNNSYSNIKLGTQKENMLDIPKDIRIERAKHAASFNSKHDKEAVRKFYAKERSYSKTMREFNLSSKGTLNYILTS